MLIPKRPVDSIRPCVCRSSPITTRTSGGSSETDVTLLAVMPCTAPPGSIVVITVTPVANLDHASRYISPIDSAVCKSVVPNPEVLLSLISPDGEIIDGSQKLPVHPLDWFRVDVP